MPSDGLFGPIFARGEAAERVSDAAWLQAMLDVEAAAARACANVGLIPSEHADAIGAACSAGGFDLDALGREAARHATPVIGVVNALREAVGPDVAPSVHLGLTSQDVVDTAAMLIAHRALGPLLDDAAAAADAAAALAQGHRTTPMIGRTLLQQALPTTFGLRVAGWMTGLDEARRVLVCVHRQRLAVQIGGPVGALAAFGEHGAAVVAGVARELGLAEPILPWQAVRVRPAQLAGALGTLAGILAKIARDVTLLASTEVDEVREGGDDPGRGGSSAMAHKHNPVSAVSALACAKRVPGLVQTVLSAMEQEHERAAGAWQAEWQTVSELLALTGAACAWTRQLLSDLEVDADRMAARLDGADAAVAAAVASAGPLVDRALAARPEIA